MGLRIGPKSIRGKLLLVFVLAVSPALIFQVLDETEEYAQARQLLVDRQSAVARAASGIVGETVAQLKARHLSLAREAAQMNSWSARWRRYREEIGDRLGPGTSSEWLHLAQAQTELPPASTGVTQITDIRKSGSGAYFALVTEVKLANNEIGRLVTRVDASMLAVPLDFLSTPEYRQQCIISGPTGSLIISPNQNKKPRFSSETTAIPARKQASEIDISDIDNAGRISTASAIEGTSWQLVLTAPLDELPGALEDRRHSFYCAVGACILGIALLFLLGNRISHPIRRLAHAANAVAVGDYRRRIHINTEDEIAVLGKAFNSLGDSLISHQDKAKQQADMLASMVEAARLTSSSLDVRECGAAVAKAICSYLGAAGAVVYRIDTGGVTKFLGQYGRAHRVGWKRLAQHTAEYGGYLVISADNCNTNEVPEGIECLVGIPLTTGSGSLGAIVAAFDEKISMNELVMGNLRADVLAAFGIHAAAAIYNAQVHSQTEKYSEVLEDWVDYLSAVMQVTDLISPSLELDQVLDALAKATAQVLRADGCAIMLPDEENYLVTRGSNSDSPALNSMRVPPGCGVSGRACAQKRYVACYDASASQDAFTRQLPETTGMRGVLSNPLMVEDTPIGALTVFSKEPRKFTPKEIRLLTSISLHAAVIVRNAGLYTREASIARALQIGLISDAPAECEGLKFAARYIPAMDEARVGGDFYDVIPLPNGKVAVVMGDVSGKGLKAAIHLATAKYMLKALIYAHPDDPSQVMGKLNDALNYYYDLSFFVTVFYAVIDPGSGVIHYSNAGHPPALLITRGRKMHVLLNSTGTPVGSSIACEYGEGRVQFEPGDMLLLYTDGVTDAPKDNGVPGMEQLHNIAFEAADCSHTELVERICQTLGGGAEPLLSDDFAVMAVLFGDPAQPRDDNTGGSGEHNYAFQAQCV